MALKARFHNILRKGAAPGTPAKAPKPAQSGQVQYPLELTIRRKGKLIPIIQYGPETGGKFKVASPQANPKRPAQRRKSW